MSAAGRLAVGIAEFGDPDIAAQVAGLSLAPDELKKLVALAHAHFPGIISNSAADISGKITLFMHALLESLRGQIDEISPRDRVAHLKTLAITRETIMGQNQTAEFAQINLTVVGADGKAIAITDE